MNYKTILITGGAGFIGSNFAVYFKKRYPNIKVVALDNLKRRGSELNVKRLKEKGVIFIHGDIRNREDLNIDIKGGLMIECSAEPSVLSGYGTSPEYIINTNLAGTVNCFELARKHKADVIFLSTSRVYPYDSINDIGLIEAGTRFQWQENRDIRGWSEEGIDTGFTLEGVRSMYGATKLCSELILREYMDMYGIKAVINRCGVIAGPWQFGKVDQGVFTLWMLAHYFKKPLKYIGFGGKGKQVRDLLHIDDFFEVIEEQIISFDKINGQTFNIGGGKGISLSLLEATGLCERISGNQIHISLEEETRPADIAIYVTDNSKAYGALGWKPKRTSEKILEDTYLWIKENEGQLSELINF